MRKTENSSFPEIIGAIVATVLVGSGSLTGCVPQNEPVRSPVSPPASPSQEVPTTATPTVVPTAVTPSPIPTAIPSTPTPAVSPGNETSLNLYWLKDDGKKLQLVPSPVKVQAGNNPSSQLQAVFRALLAGSNNSQLASTIPQGTKLRSLEVKPDGIHVNLSQEFTSGGGSASMSGRLGQVVYTATTLNPQAPVWINVEGKKLEVLGGEGLEIEQPLTRQKFQEDFEF
jgi:spore germination protein GerM